MKYFVKIMPSPDWEKADIARVDHYEWGGDYRPETTAQLICVEGRGLALKMTCLEREPKATYRNFYDEVWLDSCMEFFFGYHLGGRYINCEMNALGAARISVGDGRHGRERIDRYITPPQIHTERLPDRWSAETFFSFDDLEKTLGSAELTGGTVLYGNFYKCGEHTESPHYGMWNPVKCPEPDFHRPEWFGELILL